MTLYEAVEAQDLQAVAKALKRKEDVNQVGPGNRTPLISAAHQGDEELVEVLLAAGAEPTWKDDEMETALMKAAANGHVACVDLLLPLASPDEADEARAFLRAHGKTDGPQELRGPPTRIEKLKEAAAKYGARAASFVGYEEPEERLQKLIKARETLGKKK